MKPFFYFLCILFLVVSINQNAKAQCNIDEEKAKEIVSKKLGSDYQFSKLQTFDSNTTHNFHLTKGKYYIFRITDKNSDLVTNLTTDLGVRISVYNSQKDHIATSYLNKKYYQGITFKCPDDGVYSCEVTIEGSSNNCGAITMFERKDVASSTLNYVKNAEMDGVYIQTSDGKTIQLRGERPTIKDLSIYQGMPRKVVDDFPYFSGIDYVRLSTIKKVIFKGSTVDENSPKMYVMDRLQKMQGYKYHKYYYLGVKGGAARTIFSRAYTNDLKSYYAFSFPQKTITTTHAEWHIDRKEDWTWRKNKIYALDYGGKWYFFMIGDGEADFTSWYHDTLTK
jgi:hypothetical protein